MTPEGISYQGAGQPDPLRQRRLTETPHVGRIPSLVIVRPRPTLLRFIVLLARQQLRCHVRRAARDRDLVSRARRRAGGKLGHAKVDELDVGFCLVGEESICMEMRVSVCLFGRVSGWTDCRA